MPKRENWSRDEHILAFELYSRIPFGSIHIRNPQIQHLATLIGRRVGAVSLKLANFSRLDPALQQRGIRGMPHGAKGEEEIWAEFARDPEALALESQRILADRVNEPLETVAEIETFDLPPQGRDREAVVRVRVNQSFFRRRILSAYNFRCCVTGLGVKSLLVASHIAPWAEDKANRLNPRNGLCLNALHDRAFDRKLMWIEDGFMIRFSEKIKEAARDDRQIVDWLLSFEGKALRLPKRIAPDPALLGEHAKKCRAGA